MGESSPIDELEARKRLTQERLRLHRAELTAYIKEAVDEVTAPFQTVKSRLAVLKSKPVLYSAITVAAVGLGALAFSSRDKIARKLPTWILPLVIPAIRRMVMGAAWKWVSSRVQPWRMPPEA